MPVDPLADFPIPAAQLPKRLRLLLTPTGTSAQEVVEVTSRYEHDTYGVGREYVHMILAVVPETEAENLAVFDESGDGVVSSSRLDLGEKGRWGKYSPSISGHDYVVASWGDRSFYSYQLAEKVWMSLGLTPRCVGNNSQKIIYDDLAAPEFGVAEGEVSNEFHYEPKRNVSWHMSNAHLRRYLWMRGCVGVRCFFYEAYVPNTEAYLKFLTVDETAATGRGAGWYQLDLRKTDKGLLLQVWASVVAVSCRLCDEKTAGILVWPDVEGEMTHQRARSIQNAHYVYIDDKFLERYEQSGFYDATPVKSGGRWYCSPSYGGRWYISGGYRAGRNLIRISIRDLYNGVPDREILHAHRFALKQADVAHLDQKEEHIVAKAGRLLEQYLGLGDNLSALAAKLHLNLAAAEIIKISRAELDYKGWSAYPELLRLAQVAPLDMTEQHFLSRCKGLYEFWQRIPTGFLRNLLQRMGCAKADLKEIRSVKLLQALLNIVGVMNENHEDIEAGQVQKRKSDWSRRNQEMAFLFVNGDLRNADAHEAGEVLQNLEILGFDTATLNQGYGRALDFVFDGVINAFSVLNSGIKDLLAR